MRKDAGSWLAFERRQSNRYEIPSPDRVEIIRQKGIAAEIEHACAARYQSDLPRADV
jgi:hypothetical protein